MPRPVYVEDVPELAVGDYLRTRLGACWLVTALRPATRPRRVRALIADADGMTLPAGATVHWLWWRKRAGSGQCLSPHRNRPV